VPPAGGRNVAAPSALSSRFARRRNNDRQFAIFVSGPQVMFPGRVVSNGLPFFEAVSRAGCCPRRMLSSRRRPNCRGRKGIMGAENFPHSIGRPIESTELEETKGDHQEDCFLDELVTSPAASYLDAFGFVPFRFE